MMRSKERALLQLSTYSIIYINETKSMRLDKDDIKNEDKDEDEDEGSSRGRERRSSKSYSPIYCFRIENNTAFKEACVSRNGL